MAKNIVITGGGTGGHIYPGVALAEDIQKRYPDYSVHFIGARGGLEEKIFPRTGFPFHFLTVGRLHSSVGRWQQIKTLLSMPWTFVQCLILFFKLKPVVVLGVGGFASGPFLFVASLLQARTALWEANAQPGITNRILARFVKRCYVVFAEAKALLSSAKVLETGMPVRAEFFQKKSVVSSPKLRLLIFGGSQGAKAINELVCATLREFPQLFDVFEITHQAGHRDYKRLQAEYGALVSQMSLLEYIHDMPLELQKSDVVICRSGASTVAEVIVCQKPAIFIPLPTAADNHQYKNAKVLLDKKAAVILEQKQASSRALFDQLMSLAANSELRTQMCKELSKYDFSHSAKVLVDDLLEGLQK